LQFFHVSHNFTVTNDRQLGLISLLHTLLNWRTNLFKSY